MLAHYQSQVLAYFSRKADDYDAVDLQPYWRLSDELLWWLLERITFPSLPEAARILDAGGGTGRWSSRILQSHLSMEATLVDLSPEMISVAARKAERLGLNDRLRWINADLTKIGSLLKGESFDLVICFHNVLGFVGDPRSVVAQLCELLVPGGQLVLVVPNRYHAGFFNLRLGTLEEASAAVVTGRGRFTHDMPDMFLFTPEDLVKCCESNRMTIELLTGFPVLIYPGYQETQLYGSTTSILEVLDEPLAFQRVLSLEQQVIVNPEVAARGNNLFLAARRGE